MNRIALCLVLNLVPPLALVACEGEPPAMAPQNPSSEPATAPMAAASQEPEAPPPVAAQTACPPPPCAPAASGSGAPAASAIAVTPAPAPAATTGTVSGTVTTKPPGMAAQAVVYLEDGPKDESGHGSTASVSNRQMTFQPFVAVVATGGKVVFSNADPFPHNVFSPDHDHFNIGSIAQNAAVAHVFKEAGAYSLLCNLHPGMLGYVYVTPSGFFARTDAKGHYTLRGVPKGTYHLSAWAPREAPATSPVTVGDTEATVDFDLHR